VGVALAALTVGAWFAYSALSGKSLADVLKGGTPPLDPSGSVQGGASTDTGTDTGTGDRTALPSPVDLIPGSGSIVIDNHPVAQWIAKQVPWTMRAPRNQKPSRNPLPARRRRCQ
jgi:ABC-type cobalamin transport system ATPase subunit